MYVVLCAVCRSLNRAYAPNMSCGQVMAETISRMAGASAIRGHVNTLQPNMAMLKVGGYCDMNDCEKC